MSDFQHAQLDWDENGQPLSRAFGDVYFSRHSGLNETRHVFLATNAWPSASPRWATARCCASARPASAPD